MSLSFDDFRRKKICSKINEISKYNRKEKEDKEEEKQGKGKEEEQKRKKKGQN